MNKYNPDGHDDHDLSFLMTPSSLLNLEKRVLQTYTQINVAPSRMCLDTNVTFTYTKIPLNFYLLNNRSVTSILLAQKNVP